MSAFMTSGDLFNAAAIQAALALSTLDLFSTNTVPTKNSVLADFTLATYEGYAQKVITTVPAPIIDSVNGGISLAIPPQLFTYVDASPHTGNSIYGWLLRDAGGILIAAALLPSPVEMRANGDAIPLSIMLNIVP